MSKPRIIVASASFDERSNYVEVVCARTFADLGCEVLVVAADVHTSGEPQNKPYRIARVEKFIRVRDTYFASRGLDRIVAGFKPDAALLLAPNHGMPYSLLKHLPPSCKVIPGFGDLRESHVTRAGRWFSARGNPVIKSLVKDRWYRKLMKRADLILANTWEGMRILEELDAPSVKEKGFMCGLPVDTSHFSFDPSLRSGDHKMKTIVTVTRINPLKPVEEWVQPVIRWLRENPGWRYILGGMAAGAEGDRIRAKIEAPDLGDRYQILGRLNAGEINTLYNEADLALWFVAGIGIQQSMVTGLPVLLPVLGSVDHLVEPRVNGLYYRTIGDIPQCLTEAAAVPWDRGEIARGNAKLSALNFCAGILQRAGIDI